MKRFKKVTSWSHVIEDPRVETVSDERGPGKDPGDGLWIYLKEPYWNPVTDIATIHEWSVRECLEQLNTSVVENQDYWDSVK